MISLNENDLIVVGKIQERKGCTLARAREAYRIHAAKLADPSRLDRHDVIWENIQRGNKSASSDVKEITKEKVMPKAKKAKAKKVAKAKVESNGLARVKVELAELEREIELTPAGDEFKHVFTANLFGRKHAVIMAEIDHSKGVEDRFGYVPVSIGRLKQASDFSAVHDKLPVAIVAVVRVKGRVDQGYAVPREVFSEFMLKSKHALTLSGKARFAYRANGWDGCKFSVAKAESEKAA